MKNIVVNAGTAEFLRWLQFCNKVLADYMAENYPNNPKEHLVANSGSRYIRIDKIPLDPKVKGQSAWAFIDRTNGDVLKPASFRAPAKHARGNLFDDYTGTRLIGPYGPAYIRG